jgi:hypothetical protein
VIFNFFHADERAILFEKERLRLRKALQSYHATFTPIQKDSKSVTTGISGNMTNNTNINPNSNTISISSSPNKNNNSSNNSSQRPINAHPQRVSRITTPLNNKQFSSTASVSSANGRRVSPTGSNVPKIYAWEEVR